VDLNNHLFFNFRHRRNLPSDCQNKVSWWHFKICRKSVFADVRKLVRRNRRRVKRGWLFAFEKFKSIPAGKAHSTNEHNCKSSFRNVRLVWKAEDRKPKRSRIFAQLRADKNFTVQPDFQKYVIGISLAYIFLELLLISLLLIILCERRITQNINIE